MSTTTLSSPVRSTGAVPKAAAVPAKPQRWSVRCACPTPLRENPAVIEAPDRESARAAFFARNGISATEHSLSVEPVEAANAPERPAGG